MQGSFVHWVELNCDSMGFGQMLPALSSVNPPEPENSTLPAYYEPLLWAHSPGLLFLPFLTLSRTLSRSELWARQGRGALLYSDVLLPSVLKNIFSAFRIPSWRLLSLSAMPMRYHCLLDFDIFVEPSFLSLIFLK